MGIERNGGIAFEGGGQGGALLVLIHGLAATARVWSPMLEHAPSRWPGRWIAPDLRGHGASASRPSCRIEDYAADIASLIDRAGASAVTILGHSLGGVIALSLAGGDRIRPTRVFGLGIKVDWADDDLERLQQLSQRPPRLFENEEDALIQHRRQCGLDCEPSSSLLERGVAQDGHRWRTALDQAAFAVARPAMEDLIAASACPFHLACGEHDAMVSIERLRGLDPAAVRIAGAGHSAMVDDPGAVWDWMQAAR